MWDNHRLLRGVANLLLLASILTLLVAGMSKQTPEFKN